MLSCLPRIDSLLKEMSIRDSPKTIYSQITQELTNLYGEKIEEIYEVSSNRIEPFETNDLEGFRDLLPSIESELEEKEWFLVAHTVVYNNDDTRVFLRTYYGDSQSFNSTDFSVLQVEDDSGRMRLLRENGRTENKHSLN